MYVYTHFKIFFLITIYILLSDIFSSLQLSNCYATNTRDMTRKNPRCTSNFIFRFAFIKITVHVLFCHRPRFFCTQASLNWGKKDEPVYVTEESGVVGLNFHQSKEVLIHDSTNGIANHYDVSDYYYTALLYTLNLYQVQGCNYARFFTFVFFLFPTHVYTRVVTMTLYIYIS